MDITISDKEKVELVARAMQRAEDEMVDEIKRTTWYHLRREVRTKIIKDTVDESLKRVKEHLLTEAYVEHMVKEAVKVLTTKEYSDYGRNRLSVVEQLVRDQVAEAVKYIVNAVALRMAEKFTDVLGKELP